MRLHSPVLAPFLCLVCASVTIAQSASPVRARDLGVPFDGKPGPLNAITDVGGVEVGATTLIRGEGALKEGDPLPSVRAVAADYRLNPLTVLKGYQQLVDERLVEKRRGRGMYVSEGAQRLLLAGERERFLHEEWPQILAVIHRLGFSAQELFAQTPAVTHPAPPPRGADIKEE